jgi:arabinofuranan 3-O-arabinosyltransferase
MAISQQVVPSDRPQLSPARTIRLIGLTFALSYLVILGGSYLKGDFLADPQGRPIANDFVNVWAAGRLTLDGNPAQAYDWPVHKAAEVHAVGHDFDGYYGWHYPPTFLFVAAALATLPFLTAAALWLAATLLAYVAALGGILGARTGVFVALGFPAAVWNVTAGQNGFLTAALIGGALGLLERRPVLAGICLGLLTYKPQFGLLFPIVLIADQQWRVIAVASLIAAGLAVLSWLAFGNASWQAFAQWMPVTSRVVLGEGLADWSRLQSLFGVVRSHGGSEQLAWTVQALGSIAVAVGVVWLWRSRSAYELKAAALAAGTLLVTPYVYMYDLVILAIAVAFLLRFALTQGFTAADVAGLGCGATLVLIYPAVPTQVGLLAVLIVTALIVRRAVLGRAPIVTANSAP